MKSLVLIGLASLGQVAAEAAPGNGQSITLILALLSSGGVVTLFVSKWLNRKQDGVGLSEKAVKMVQDSLDAVDAIRRQFNELRGEMDTVQNALREAERKIKELEAQIATDAENREKLEAQLAEAIRVRDMIDRRYRLLAARVEGMEAVMSEGKQGPKGEAGPEGPAGRRGQSGHRGAQGEPGQTGQQGQAGETGHEGEQGEPG